MTIETPDTQTLFQRVLALERELDARNMQMAQGFEQRDIEIARLREMTSTQFHRLSVLENALSVFPDVHAHLT